MPSFLVGLLLAAVPAVAAAEVPSARSGRTACRLRPIAQRRVTTTVTIIAMMHPAPPAAAAIGMSRLEDEEGEELAALMVVVVGVGTVSVLFTVTLVRVGMTCCREERKEGLWM